MAQATSAPGSWLGWTSTSARFSARELLLEPSWADLWAEGRASKGYNALLSGNGGKPGAFDYGLGHIKLEHKYVVELINRLEDALHLTHSSDQGAAGDLNKTAGDGGILG
jgi:hypothetical protein